MADNNQKPWSTPKILSDSPLRETDIARFHFDQFAITLARLIAEPTTRTPLTIGVSGKWGSGKTTLLQRVKKLLDELDGKIKPSFANQGETAKSFRKCKTVWFDAWKYNDEDELLVALVRVILNTMGQGSFGEQLWSEVLDPVAPRYDVLATFLNMFKLKFGGVEISADLNKYKTETPFAAHTAFFDHFNSAFEELLACWVHGKGDFRKIDETKGALVVFIDDLDRCLPEKVVQVLEAVKLFLDKDGCAFVLGADTEIIQEAVIKHYNDAGVKGENVGDYIEKLIQLRFVLPPIPEEDMNAYVQEHVEDEALVEHWRIITAGAEANPRKVKTFLNDLRLRWAMWQNTGQAGGVDYDDFVRWEVLMRAAPKFRTRVYGIPDPQLRYELVQNAFKMAGGDEPAAASFKDDINPPMRAVLKTILRFADGFTLDVVSRLMYVVAPPVVETPKETKVIIEEVLEKPIIGRLEKTLEDATLQTEGTLETAQIQNWGDIPFVFVPKGKFLMGSRKENRQANNNEKEQHVVDIKQDYWIGKFPVINAEFENFIQASQYTTFAEKEGGWNPKTGALFDNQKEFEWRHPLGSNDTIIDKPNHPVVQVNWHDALAFCEWLNQRKGTELPRGYVFRLPTEAEWEKAARGEFGNEWPWGNEFNNAMCNSFESNKGGTTPVDKYVVLGDSPYGAADMAGNVWEWTQSLFTDYPYNVDDGRELLSTDGSRVLRGGSFLRKSIDVRCATRGVNTTDARRHNFGFRIVVAPILNF